MNTVKHTSHSNDNGQRSICLCYLCEELSGYVGDVVVSVNRVDERDSKHSSQEIFRHQTI